MKAGVLFQIVVWKNTPAWDVSRDGTRLGLNFSERRQTPMPITDCYYTLFFNLRNLFLIYPADNNSICVRCASTQIGCI